MKDPSGQGGQYCQMSRRQREKRTIYFIACLIETTGQYHGFQHINQFTSSVLVSSPTWASTKMIPDALLPITFYQTNQKLLLIQLASFGLLRERVSILYMLLNIFIIFCGDNCKIPSGLDYFAYIFSSDFSYLLNHIPCIDNHCVKKI